MSLNLIKTQTASTGTRNLTFPDCFSAGYAWYKIAVIGIQPSQDNATLVVQYVFNNNPEGAKYYNVAGYSNDSGGNTFYSYTNEPFIALGDYKHRGGADATTGVNAVIQVYGPSTSNEKKCIDFKYAAPVSYQGSMCIAGGAGAFYQNESAVDGVNFFLIDGNGNQIDMVGGKINIYGITGN